MRCLNRYRWLVCFLFWGSILGPASAADPNTSDQPLLFNSIEFRGPAIGGWHDFSRHIEEALEIFRTARTHYAKSATDEQMLTGLDDMIRRTEAKLRDRGK